MKSKVSMEAKKDFIRWVLRNHKFKMREAIWVLNYALSHDGLLENMVFVDDTIPYDRVLIASAVNAEGASLGYRHGSLVTTDAEKIFNHLRLDIDLTLYVKVNFPYPYNSDEYLAVLEGSNNSTVNLSLEVKEETAKAIVEAEKILLMGEIDRALDSGDMEKFMELSEMLQSEEEKSFALS